MHFHRDVMAACACWPPHVLRAQADDVFIGSPPLAFTFGLGGLLLFPLASAPPRCCCRAATPERPAAPSPRTAPPCCSPRPPPTARWPRHAGQRRLRRQGAAAQVRVGRRGAARGHPRAVAAGHRHRDHRRHRRHRAAAHLHLGRRSRPKPGATGKPMPATAPAWSTTTGSQCRRAVGRLACKGPTGCRYLDDERQASYVQGGWNLTGDAYLQSTPTATSTTRPAPTT
jgi:2-aminobenzoate-CoA ligase